MAETALDLSPNHEFYHFSPHNVSCSPFHNSNHQIPNSPTYHSILHTPRTKTPGVLPTTQRPQQSNPHGPTPTPCRRTKTIPQRTNRPLTGQCTPLPARPSPRALSRPSPLITLPDHLPQHIHPPRYPPFPLSLKNKRLYHPRGRLILKLQICPPRRHPGSGTNNFI